MPRQVRASVLASDPGGSRAARRKRSRCVGEGRSPLPTAYSQVVRRDRIALAAVAVSVLTAFACAAPSSPSRAPAPESQEAATASPSPAPSFGAEPCAIPDARQNARRFDEARGLYEQILKNSPGQACALDGIATLTTERIAALTNLENGRAAQSRGNKGEARTAFSTALAIDPSLSEATEALLALDATPSSTPDLFAYARELLQHGYPAEAAAAAKDALKEALKSNPEAAFPSGLDFLPGQSPPFTGAFLADETRRKLAGLAGELGIPFLGILFVIAFVALWWWSRHRSPRLLELGAFDDTALTGRLGPSVAGQIAAEMTLMREDGAGSAIGIVTGIDSGLNLPEPIAVPPLKALSTLLAFFQPARAVLTGQLTTDAAMFGRSLTLSLQRRNAVESVELSAREYCGLPTQAPVGSSEAEEFRLLALGGAAWTAYALLDGESRQRLPTHLWTSYARFRAGAELQKVGQADRARRLYTDALALDPANRNALFNLGTLDLRQRRDTAHVRLARARALTMKQSDGYPEDRVWYRSSYNLALERHQASLAYDRAGNHDQGDRLAIEAENLAVETAQAASGRIARGVGSVEEKQFFTLVEQAGLVLLAGIRSRLRRAGDGGQAPNCRLDLRRRLPVLSAEQLIGYLGDADATVLLPNRVQYNLASYFAERGEFKDAWRQLELALQDDRLRETARNDPSLEGLRKRECGLPWGRIVGPEPTGWLVRFLCPTYLRVTLVLSTCKRLAQKLPS